MPHPWSRRCSFRTSVSSPAARANGRALAYLAHQYLGNRFGTLYDVSTILILWFAGASAMAGLLNLVPRYLPRYGMAPEWTRATRPLVLVFTGIAFVVTLIFRADVDKQGGAYATGVLVLITSAAIAVALSVRRKGSRSVLVAYVTIACIFVYTTIVNVFERPDGVKIAAFFIGAIILTSFVSRIRRATELRVERVVLDETATRFIDEMAAHGEIRLIANQPDARDIEEYFLKEKEEREDAHIPPDDPVLFLEVTVKDPSEFSDELHVHGEQVGAYRVLRMESPAISNAIAALLLTIRDRTGKIPHVYFGWGEEGPLTYLGRYLLFGDGDIPPVTREVLREAEPDPTRRPHVHVA